MRHFINFIFKEFIYNGHLQSLGVVAVVYLSVILFVPKALSPDILVLSYLLFEIIFLNDRYIGFSIDGKTNSERTDHLKSYLKKIPIVMGISLLLIVSGLLYFSNINTLIFSGIIVLMGMLYPTIFKGLTKQIWLFKNFYVALFYASMLIYPFFYYNEHFVISAPFVLIGILIFLNSLSGQIVLDVKDVSIDKRLGLKTLPVVVDLNSALLIAKIIKIVVSLLLILYGWRYGYIILTYLGIINLTVGIIAIEMVSRKNKIGYIVAAGEFFLWFCYLLTANIIL